MKSVSNCIVCNKKLTGKQRSFCSIVCKNDYYLCYEAIKSRGLERKSRLVAMLGGKCGRCGYERSTDALSFYDSTGGSLHIDINMLANSNYEKLAAKVESAQVLCRNCVEEVQNPNEILKLVQDDELNTLSSRAKSRDLGKTVTRFLHSLRSVEMTVDSDSVEMTENGGSSEMTEDSGSVGLTKEIPTIVLGVSGGIDSVVVLDLFASNYPKERLIVAHLNHGLRAESGDDERFVRELARSYGVSYVTKKIVTPKSGNLEEFFRDERRRFLLEVVHGNDADLVALGHNADDQAETVLMNLVRGSGPAGLSGMQVHENSTIRPLLEISRAEIENYAREHSLAWQEDETNADQHYSRNYIRKQILPLLSRLNPEYLANIGRSAKIQQDLDRYVRNETTEILKQVQEDGFLSLNSRLRGNDKVVPYEVFGQMYENVKGNRTNLGREHLESIAKLIADNNGTKTVDLPDGFTATRRYDTLEINYKKVDNTVPPISENVLKIGKQIHECFAINVSLSSERSQSQYELLIDRESLPFILVRDVRPGDAIDKYGVSGKKKLQDLFVDAKIDRDRRKRWPIFVDTRSGEIVWVPGLAITKYMVPNQGDLLIKVSEE